ncbi:MAG: hypothetical protein ACR2QC_11155 [Gammaproteobacteria bacterium]
MKHRFAAKFWAEYAGLPPYIRRRVDRCIAMLNETPPRPSLQLKRVDSPRAGWTARVNRDYRMAAEEEPGDVVVWVFIGTHAEQDKLLRRR